MSGARTDMIKMNQSMEELGASRNGTISEEYRLPSFKHSIVRKYLKFTLCFCHIDPFSIYKDNYARLNDTKYWLYLSPTLMLYPGQFERFWHRVETPHTLFVYYVSIKYTLIYIMQILTCIVMHQQQQQQLQQHVSNSGTIEYSSKITSPILIDQKQQVELVLPTKTGRTTLELLDCIGHALAGSLWTITGGSFLILSTLTMCTFYAFVINSRNYKKNPMNSVNIRFILDPAREIRRIDLMIKQQLKEILRENRNNKLVYAQFRQIEAMRPSIFSLDWHHKSCHYLFRSIVWLVPSLFGTEVLSAYLFQQQTKGEWQQSNNCEYNDTFTFRDFISLLELFCARFITSSYIILMFIIVCSDLIFIQSIVRETKSDLKDCLNTITQAVAGIKSSPGYSFNKLQVSSNQTDSTTRNRFSGANNKYSFGTENSKTMHIVEVSLLINYIKLMVTLCEIERSAQSVRKHVESILIIVAIALINLAITIIVDSPGERSIQLAWLVLCWTAINPVLFGCAFVYSQTVRSEKIAWSISAAMRSHQNVALQTSLLRAYSSSDGLIGSLAIRWRRLIESFSLSDRRNSVRPFGMSLTYGQVLRMNFFILSIVSLRQTF